MRLKELFNKTGAILFTIYFLFILGPVFSLFQGCKEAGQWLCDLYLFFGLMPGILIAGSIAHLFGVELSEKMPLAVSIISVLINTLFILCIGLYIEDRKKRRKS
jgi:hypothetical protein